MTDQNVYTFCDGSLAPVAPQDYPTLELSVHHQQQIDKAEQIHQYKHNQVHFGKKL